MKAAFAKHTNWANIANELRINRPMAPPIFRVDGRSITSDQEAIEAMTNYIEKVYAEPKEPIRIPPWDVNHDVKIREYNGGSRTCSNNDKGRQGHGFLRSIQCMHERNEGRNGQGNC